MIVISDQLPQGREEVMKRTWSCFWEFPKERALFKWLHWARGCCSCGGRPQDWRIRLPRVEGTRGLLQLQRRPQLPQLNKQQLFNMEGNSSKQNRSASGGTWQSWYWQLPTITHTHLKQYIWNTHYHTHSILLDLHSYTLPKLWLSIQSWKDELHRYDAQKTRKQINKNVLEVTMW